MAVLNQLPGQLVTIQVIVDSGYQAHPPITLSCKRYELNNVYVLNKQVSKYMVMALFSSKIVYFHLYLLVMDLHYHACALHI